MKYRGTGRRSSTNSKDAHWSERAARQRLMAHVNDEPLRTIDSENPQGQIACWCTGLRHEHDRHGCPPEPVDEERKTTDQVD